MSGAGADGGKWKRRWQAIPRKPWLVAIIVLVLLAQFASSSPALSGARAFGERLVADLWQISPVELVTSYVDRFTQCDPEAAPLRALDAEDCGAGRFLSFTRPFRILLDVVADASVGLSPAGGPIFVVASALSLVLALAAAVLLIAAIEEELFAFSLLLAFPLAPVMFSLVIYAMKWLSWLFLSAFGGPTAVLLLLAVLAGLFYKGACVCRDGFSGDTAEGSAGR